MQSNFPIFFKYLLVSILISSGSSLANAQNKFSVTAGWGYYELANAGLRWNITKISSFSLYGGTNFRLRDYKSWSAGLSFDQTFQKPLFLNLKPGYSLGLLYWTRDDELYYFENISFPVMALLSYPVSASVSARAEGGIIFTSVMASERKQNVEAGYPQRFNGSFRLSIIYTPNAK